MMSRASSPRRLQSQNSIKKEEIGMDSPLLTGRQPLRVVPEASASRSSSASEQQTEPGSPSRPSTPRGKKRAAAVYRQSENVDGNLRSASNSPEKPREKRTTLTRVSKAVAPLSSKLPVTASLARSLQESLQQTDAANKSWYSDSIGGTPTMSIRTPLIPTTGASKSCSTEQISRVFKFSGKPPLDSELSRTCFGSNNSSFLQSTPSRSVNRSLRYGATPGSAASIGSARAPGSGTKSSGPFRFGTGQQILAQQFDFEEDPAFWEDHNVQVILRTRPISTSESAFKGFSRCVRQENSHSITWIGQPESRFTFDHVAGDHITQEQLFRVAGVPMVENCMAGYNSCMFCYGQTGSGKTHTMLGDIVDLEQRPSDDRGILPRVFEYLFSKIQKEEESRTDEHLKYVCKCSFLEIFNEQITDLLEPSSTNLQVREGGRKGVYVENLSEVAVGSVQDVVHLLLLGAANRKVAATNMNRESSRSHSVFTCTIESKWEFNSATNIRFGRLNLVDLAGSERQKSSGAEGERLKEAANINKSLSTLGLVIMILVDVANGKQRHVPYRDSKLTYLLQDSLGGNSKTTMIANISPSSCCALETLSTLKFAQRAKFIRNNAVVNEDASGDVNGLRQEIQELKEELDRIRRQELHRTPSMHSVASAPQVSVQKGDDDVGMAVVTIDEQEQSRCSIDAWEFTKASSGPRFSNKKMEAMEAVLAGALRREQEAELSQKRQAAEIEQLTRLVKQREDDSQCGKMLLRFREDKIRRLEAMATNVMSADLYLRQENDLLMHELRLIQEKSDRNPELTRFAMENIRLLEQLRRFQDFYTGGERDAMADEISNLRDQLLEVLDSKLSLTALSSPQKEALAPELAAAQREIELLRIETDNYRREVEDCRKNLSSILEANSRITKQLDESNAELQTVKSKNLVHQEELQKLREQALDAEAIEWDHAHHLELISQLKTKLQQSEDRADLEASLRFELDRQLSVSLEEAADLHSDLQETKGVLDTAEMLVSCLQSTESNLSVAQEMATLARSAVKQIYLEAKEIADDQHLSLKHSMDAVVAACSKETELREELEDARSLIQKLVSVKDGKVCSGCSVASVTANEQVHGILVSNRTVDVRQLEQDLKSLDIFAEHGCRDVITSSTESAIEEMENITKVCDETPMAQKKQFRCLDPGTECILKLNFTQETQTGDDGSLLEVEPDTTKREFQSAESTMSALQGDQDLQVFQGNSINHVDLDLVQAVLSLQDEIMKLKPQVARHERREAATKWSTIELVKELQSLVLVVQAVLGEKKNLITQNEALLKEKDTATKAHQEWEAATTRLMENLNEGEHALTDAVHEMEGILDDCLSQPTAIDISRVREREHVDVRRLDMTTTPTAERKYTDKSREAVGNDHINGVERNFAVCTTMLQWFSETLTAERAAKRISTMQNDHAKEELCNKDDLIASLQKQLERALASSDEKESSISKLQTEYDEDRARLMNADAQTAAAIKVDAELRDDIENRCLEPATVLTRMDDTELELALMQDELTRLRTELIGSNMERDKLALEEEQLAALFSNDGKVLEKSCLVAATMVWWLQTKIAGDEIAHKLNYDDISSQVRDLERTVLSLRDEIAEKTMLLKEQMGNEEIHAHQSLEHMQEIDSTRKEISEKDSLINVMQTSVLKLQDELSASEGQSMQLVMEKEKLHIKLREVTEKTEALQGVVSSVKRELEEAETKVVELAVVQAGMLIVQEEWGLEKDELERDSSEAKQRCTQIVQELELARKEALKFESELEEAKTQETVLRVEKDKLVTSLQEELKRTQNSTEVFKEQLELNQTSMIELHSRLQKQLDEWEIEKETMSSAAALAHDQCLEKDQALTSMQTCLATSQSQLFDACSRESKLSHELEELLESKENTQCEIEMLRSKTEELVLVLNRQDQEVNSLNQVLEMKLQIVDDKAEDTHRQIKAILVDLDALIIVKGKLEADAESLERQILNHCSSLEEKLVNANEDKNQLKELWSVRETELIAGLNTVQSENTSFVVLVQTLEDALETSKIEIKKKEEEITVLQRHMTESESKAVKTQEKLRSSNLLMKDLARSEEQLKLQTDALAAENKRLTRCMACREMEFSSLQGQIEGLEKSLKESHEKESMTSMALCNLKENLKVLEKQWRIEKEQMKDRLATANRKLLESQEMKQIFYSALKELEGEILATEKKCKVTIGELETQWSIARGDMSNHLIQISLDFVEVRSCAEETHLDLAKTQSLLSAADAAIEQLLDRSSALKDSNDELLVKQEALQLELSRWERYAVELQRSSCYFPSVCNDNNAIADSAGRSDKNCFDILMTEVENIRCYCEKLQAQVVDKDSTILSIQMELSATVASSRQLEIELTAVADERSDLKLQLDSISTELVNAQDEVKRRDMELKTFGSELQKVIEVLAETEEKMDESSREWRQQIEEVKAEMEGAKLCASGKNRELIMLRKQFEDGQATLQEAESLVNALVRANETAKRDMLSSKWREEKLTFQSTELLSMINEEVSVTIDYVETQLQDLSIDIHGTKALVTDFCSETAADFARELKEVASLHISEMQGATEGAHIKLAKINAKVIDLEQRLNTSVVENEALQNLLSQSQLQNAEMLQSSQEVVNHFSLFQSQLDVCFQQNKELERNKLVLTAEVYSLSQELVETKNLRQASECCLDELRTAFAQLEKQKDEEVRVLSDEVEKLKSQEAAMEVDLWDWEQRCQDAEVQLDEKVSEFELLRGKLLSTQEECKEQLELVYDELRECQRRAAEMDSERRDMIIEIEEGSSILADLQTKLQARESEMEEHFSRHCIEQEVLDSLEKENRELQSSVKHLTAEVAANQQRASTAENMQVETRLEMEAFERDLKQKDDLIQTLESDLNLLQESALQELRLNQELDSLRVTTDVLQQELNMQKERRTRLEIEVAQVTEEIVQTKNQAATWKGKAYEFETELDKKRQTIESLEDELRMAEQNMANTLEEATIDLKEVENERDRLQIEVLELTEQLELTQMMVQERDAVVSELHQAGEQSRTHVKEKEDEAKLLTRSVHELESTVYALESQLGLLKREAERQRLLREDIEMESQKLNNHIFVTQSALEESNIRNAEELKDALSALRETERKVEDKEADLSHLRRKLENLEITSKDKDVQMKDAMTQISDLLVAAEVQKADYQQKLKWMESEVERVERVNREIQSACVTSNSNEVATEVVSSEASPAQESYSQRDMTHVSCLSRIKELEELALSRQKELFTLHTRLAEAESMTHDVLRDLLGVKADMNNVVSMLDHQQIKQLAETACRKNVEAEEKETELSSLRSQLDAYMEERQSLVEEVNLRQCEVVAARVAAERFRQKEQVLTDEIEKFRLENINHQENIRELEMEIRKLPTSQQSFTQQINHHAKIKEENQALRLASEELSKELRRTELLYAGVHDELSRYRSAESRSSSSSFDEERSNLLHRLQDAENNQAQSAQKLTSLCSAVIQAAGLAVPETVDAAGAMDALQLLENRLRSSDVEHSNSKYKKKVTGERRRRTDVKAKDSPLRSISNFTELLQRPSSASPAPR